MVTPLLNNGTFMTGPSKKSSNHKASSHQTLFMSQGVPPSVIGPYNLSKLLSYSQSSSDEADVCKYVMNSLRAAMSKMPQVSCNYQRLRLEHAIHAQVLVLSEILFKQYPSSNWLRQIRGTIAHTTPHARQALIMSIAQAFIDDATLKDTFTVYQINNSDDGSKMGLKEAQLRVSHLGRHFKALAQAWHSSSQCIRVHPNTLNPTEDSDLNFWAIGGICIAFYNMLKIAPRAGKSNAWRQVVVDLRHAFAHKNYLIMSDHSQSINQILAPFVQSQHLKHFSAPLKLNARPFIPKNVMQTPTTAV